MSKYAIISDDVMLKDKVVIVTGASSGIGRATAIALASHGCKVAIGARRTSNLEKLQDEIEKSGGQAFAQKLDVSDRQNCNSFVNEVLKKWNTIITSKDPFCPEHRLPEDHRCVKLTQIRSKKFGEKKIIRDGGPKKGFLRRIFGRN